MREEQLAGELVVQLQEELDASYIKADTVPCDVPGDDQTDRALSSVADEAKYTDEGPAHSSTFEYDESGLDASCDEANPVTQIWSDALLLEVSVEQQAADDLEKEHAAMRAAYRRYEHFRLWEPEETEHWESTWRQSTGKNLKGYWTCEACGHAYGQYIKLLQHEERSGHSPQPPSFQQALVNLKSSRAAPTNRS